MKELKSAKMKTPGNRGNATGCLLCGFVLKACLKGEIDLASLCPKVFVFAV